MPTRGTECSARQRQPVTAADLGLDGNGLPLVIAVTPGQANDSPALPKLLAELRVPRLGPGRPHTTPLALRADKAYSARAHRGHLRSRGIAAVIPEQSDQIRNQKNRGSRGGRPDNFDAHDYENRNVGAGIHQRTGHQLADHQGCEGDDPAKPPVQKGASDRHPGGAARRGVRVQT